MNVEQPGMFLGMALEISVKPWHRKDHVFVHGGSFQQLTSALCIAVLAEENGSNSKAVGEPLTPQRRMKFLFLRFSSIPSLSECQVLVRIDSCSAYFVGTS